MARRTPKVIAHRGLRSSAPENTVEAIAAAIKLPVYGVEFDIDLTKDDVPILIHQETMVPNATFTGIELGARDEGRAWTHDVLWREIKDFDVGSWFRPSFSHIRFSTFDQVVDLDWGSVVARIELKSPGFYRGGNLAFCKRIVEVITPQLRRFLEKGGRAELLSFDPEVLAECRSAFPEVDTVLAIDPCFAPAPNESLKVAEEVGATHLIVWDRWLIEDARWLEGARRLGLSPWTFELSPDLKQLESGLWSAESLYGNWQTIFDLGVDGLHCDFPAECLHYFERFSNEFSKAL